MKISKALPSNFRHVRLMLAREEGHPEGDWAEGYDLLVPLLSDNRLDSKTWQEHQALCRVRHFSENKDDRIGKLKRTAAGQWYFDYKDEEDDKEMGFHFGDESFTLGEYISVMQHGKMHTYRVIRVEKP